MSQVKKWNRPNWTGAPVAIVASGPSLHLNQIAALKKENIKTIVINDNYLLAPFAEILYACDLKWWDWHWSKPELKQYRGQKVTQDIKAAKQYPLEYIESSGRCGLSTDVNLIHQGCNSGYQAINLAVHTGTTYIMLLGYDMKATSKTYNHWFGLHPDRVVSNYESWMPLYNGMSAQAKDLGVKIVNCTIDTALTCFDRIPLNDAIEKGKLLCHSNQSLK